VFGDQARQARRRAEDWPSLFSLLFSPRVRMHQSFAPVRRRCGGGGGRVSWPPARLGGVALSKTRGFGWPSPHAAVSTLVVSSAKNHREVAAQQEGLQNIGSS
jgi:hypothetical protein